MINRRNLLMSAAAGAAGAASATTIAVQPGFAMQNGTMAQAPAFQRTKVGDIIVTAVADGHFTFGAEAGLFPGITADDFTNAMRDAFLPTDAYKAPVNAYVVQSGGNTILIDAGAAPGMAPTVGKLAGTLEAAGVSPSDVTHVFITHMHPDHTGMLLTDGAPTFDTAELVIHAAEIGFWADEGTKALLPEARHGMVTAAQAVEAAYIDAMVRIQKDGEVAPGVSAVSLPGHTPGHTGFRIASGDEQLLIWGDIIHSAPLQLPNPRRTIVFDSDPQKAAETRLKLFDEVVTDRIMVAGMHMPFPGFGYLDTSGEGYEFVRADWTYSL
ncbi:MAG: MBL fold metallo-hydrolase [Pseudomonadota bacterium]